MSNMSKEDAEALEQAHRHFRETARKNGDVQWNILDFPAALDWYQLSDMSPLEFCAKAQALAEAFLVCARYAEDIAKCEKEIEEQKRKNSRSRPNTPTSKQAQEDYAAMEPLLEKQQAIKKGFVEEFVALLGLTTGDIEASSPKPTGFDFQKLTADFIAATESRT